MFCAFRHASTVRYFSGTVRAKVLKYWSLHWAGTVQTQLQQIYTVPCNVTFNVPQMLSKMCRKTYFQATNVPKMFFKCSTKVQKKYYKMFQKCAKCFKYGCSQNVQKHCRKCSKNVTNMYRKMFSKTVNVPKMLYQMFTKCSKNTAKNVPEMYQKMFSKTAHTQKNVVSNVHKMCKKHSTKCSKNVPKKVLQSQPKNVNVVQNVTKMFWKMFRDTYVQQILCAQVKCTANVVKLYIWWYIWVYCANVVPQCSRKVPPQCWFWMLCEMFEKCTLQMYIPGNL